MSVGPGEYSGGDGLVQPSSKGHTLGDEQAGVESERRMIEAMAFARERAGLPALSDEEMRQRLERGKRGPLEA